MDSEEKTCWRCDGKGNTGIPTQGDYLFPEECLVCGGSGKLSKK